MNNIETLLNEEICSELEELKKMELGTEEYKTTVDGLAKLVDKTMDFKKFEFESNEKVIARENEEDFKADQMKNEKKDNIIRNVLTAAGIVIPTAVTIWGTLKTFKFEEEGTVTTMLGRGFINKLLPKK